MHAFKRSTILNRILLITAATLSLFVVKSTLFFLCCIIIIYSFSSYKAFKLCTAIALIGASTITALIILSLVTQTISFFKVVPPLDFFLGSVWAPNGTILNGQFEKLFGILPILFGTCMVAIIAILIAAPVGVGSAIFLRYITNDYFRRILKPIIEVMAGIPTIVYGYFSITFVSSFLQELGSTIHLHISTESALCAGIVIGIMLIPLITSLTDELFRSVPKGLYYGAAALGSTQYEIISRVILPYCFPGILGVILLAFSRALGETMVVLMMVGVSAHLDYNPLNPITTITVQIATILTGDQTFNSKETLSAYALGLTLFFLTWGLNAISMSLSSRYKKDH